MGLDVYVGSFTRYYAHDWETIVQRAGREQGIPVEIVRQTPLPSDALTDPDAIREGILAWRSGLSESLRREGVIRDSLDWSEQPDAPYFTDKPDWDCFGALLLLAAYEETEKALVGSGWPRDLPEDWPADPVLQRQFEARAASRYSHLYGCEIWLPHELPGPFSGPSPPGKPQRFGSSVGLLAQLEELNRRTYRGALQDQKDWRNSMPEGSNPRFEPRAKTGLAIMLELTRAAVDNRLPMLLDY